MSIRYVETGAFEAVITHNRYTLLNRSAEPLIDMASARGLAVVNAAPYGSGILAKGPDAYPRYAYQDAPAEMVERVRRMDGDLRGATGCRSPPPPCSSPCATRASSPPSWG